MITEVLMSFDESPINIVSVVSTCVRDTFPKAGYIAGNFPIFGLVTPSQREFGDFHVQILEFG